MNYEAEIHRRIRELQQIVNRSELTLASMAVMRGQLQHKLEILLALVERPEKVN